MAANKTAPDMTHPVKKIAARRNAPPRKNLVWFTEIEPHAAHAQQKRFFVRSIDLATQSSDMHIDKVCLGEKSVVPDIFQKHVAGHHPIRSTHEIFQELELAF